MWKQSVWSSTIAGNLATKFLKPGGLLTLTGAAPATDGTPGGMCLELDFVDQGCAIHDLQVKILQPTDRERIRLVTYIHKLNF